MSPSETRRQEIDWDSCTFEGSEREQLRVWSALPLRQKLMALEEMSDMAYATIERRKAQRLPYIDPFTGEVVRGAAVPKE